MQEGQSFEIKSINGSEEFKAFLQTLGIVEGIQITKNYSPKYAKLINLTVASKMISLHTSDFNKLTLSPV